MNKRERNFDRMTSEKEEVTSNEGRKAVGTNF